MKLSPGVLETRRRFVQAFPLPQKRQGEGDEQWNERIRTTWTIPHAEQQHYEHPTEGYGVKRGDPGRPICKDCLAQQQPSGTLIGWDLLIGAAGGSPTLSPDPTGEDITGQAFVEVKPVNHLADLVLPHPGGDPDANIPPKRTLGDYVQFARDLRALYLRVLERDVLKDPVAIANWLYHWREDGRDLLWIESMVKTSDEWKKLQTSKGRA